jgi:hypothetical protein
MAAKHFRLAQQGRKRFPDTSANIFVVLNRLQPINQMTRLSKTRRARPTRICLKYDANGSDIVPCRLVVAALSETSFRELQGSNQQPCKYDVVINMCATMPYQYSVPPHARKNVEDRNRATYAGGRGPKEGCGKQGRAKASRGDTYSSRDKSQH